MSVAEAPAIVRSTKKHVDSRLVPPTQKPSIQLPGLGEELEHGAGVIEVVSEPLTVTQAQGLLFNEDPITLFIHRSSEKFSPKCTDLISINGIKAEVLCRNSGITQWIQMGYLPRGMNFITKRKYVEALALSKMDHITTRVDEQPGRDPFNMVDSVTTATNSFTIVEDKNPLGIPWLANLLRQSSM